MTKYFQRWIEDEISGRKSSGKIRIIYGARQTGKTILLKRILPEKTSIVFNLLDTRIRRLYERDPSAIRREIEALPKSITHVAVDEIQKVPALLDEIQFLYDQDPDSRVIVLTGSSARKLRRYSANLLPGRCHIYHLFPIMRPEEKFYSGGVLGPAPIGKDGFPTRRLEDRLQLGNLPGIQREEAETASATLEAYVENYLEEEIRREGLVREVGPFSQFLRLAAMESGQQTNLARLSQESGVPASTIRLYYDLLVDTFVGYRLFPYAKHGRKKLLTTPRFLFFDLGVRNAAMGRVYSHNLLPDEAGRLFEQWVGLELLYRSGYAGRSCRVSFWRTKSGAEVDYIWESPHEDIPIEVKWTTNPQPSDAKHLETFLDLYGSRAKHGYVVCRVQKRQQLTPRVQAIPWSEL